MILVVDDEPTLRTFITLCLRQMGHTSIESQSASEAIETLARSGPFDLLITDYSLPGMTGLQLAEEIRARNRVLPILFVSANPEEPPEVFTLRKSGRIEFLSKPFKLQDLHWKLTILLKPFDRTRVADWKGSS